MLPAAAILRRAPRAQERMNTETSAVPRESLTLVEHGLFPIRIHANLSPSALIEHALRRSEGQLTDHGAFAAVTTPHTGRSPKDKFVIEEPGGADRIWREKNPRLDPEAFDRLHEDVRGHLDARELYVQDLFGGADPAYRVPVRFITPNAWHALFVRNMFIRAVPPGRSRPARHPERDLHRDPLRQEAGADRGHPVRRRDEEVDLHRAQLPAAGTGRHADALLGQHRSR